MSPVGVLGPAEKSAGPRDLKLGRLLTARRWRRWRWTVRLLRQRLQLRTRQARRCWNVRSWRVWALCKVSTLPKPKDRIKPKTCLPSGSWSFCCLGSGISGGSGIGPIGGSEASGMGTSGAASMSELLWTLLAQQNVPPSWRQLKGCSKMRMSSTGSLVKACFIVGIVSGLRSWSWFC